MVVPAGQLKSVLGVRTATFISKASPIALVDPTLDA